MHILEIASELPPVQSGVARAAGRILDGLVARGHEVTRLSSVDAPRRYLGEFRFSMLGAKFVRLQRLVASADLVHLTGPAPFIADALLARWRMQQLLGSPRLVSRGSDTYALPPLVYTHGFTLELDGAAALSAAYRRTVRPLFRAADAVVVTTPSYQRLVEQHFSGRVEVIGWASSLAPHDRPSSQAYTDERRLRVLFVGQQRPYKGIGHLIDAAAGLEGVDVTIMGGGPQQQQYEEQIRSLVGTNITHRGRVTDAELGDALRTHDVLCLPSTNASEAFGLVLVEAMSQGCTVVASRLPGVVDVVGEAGVIVEPKDVDGLRRALSELAAEPARVRSLQAAGQRKAAEYDWDRSADQYEQLYQELVDASEGS